MKNNCYRLPVVHIASALKVALLLSIGVFSCLVISTVVLFLRFVKTTTVRSSDMKLTLVIPLSMLAGCVCMALQLSTVSIFSCILSRVFSSLAQVLCNATILVKTSRLARLVRKEKRLRPVERDLSLSTLVQSLLILLLTAMAALVESAGAAFSSPTIEHQYTETRTVEVCLFPRELAIVSDAYSMSLLGMTVVLAFFTQKLPLNQNEARLLFLASFTQGAVWTVLRPLYYLVRPYNREVLGVLLYLITYVVLWLWLFVPCLYALFFKPHASNILHWTQSTFSCAIGRGLSRREFNVKILASHNLLD